MRAFGALLGIAALAHVLSVWGLKATAAVMLMGDAIALAVLVGKSMAAGPRQYVDAFLSSKDAPYVAWLAAILVVFSTGPWLPGNIGKMLWQAGFWIAVLFWVFGLWDLRRHAEAIELVHVAWFAPLLVSVLDCHGASKSLSGGLQIFGWLGFFAMALVLIAATWRAMKHGTVMEMRSPWYAIGGASIMSLWAHAALPTWASFLIMAALLSLAAYWVRAITGTRSIVSRGAWSNLFSLCSLALLLLALDWRVPSMLVTAAACLVAAIDLWRTTRGWIASRAN